MIKLIARLTWALYILGIMGGMIACKSEKKDKHMGKPATGTPLQVEGFLVRSGAVNSNIEVSGTLLPYEATEVRPEISGRVVQLNISEGNTVSRGSLLVKLFDGDLQAQLRKLNVQLQIAQKTEERQAELLKINGISQQDYDLSLLQVSNIKADMEIIRTNISKTEIRAPYDGRLGLKNISPGAYISPTTLVTTISQVNQLKVQFSIPEKYGATITRGQEVSFTVEGNPGLYRATVMASESLIDENTRTLRILALVKDRDKSLTPGAYAKVALQLGVTNNALMVPSQAIIPQARNKKIIIYRGGKARFETVTTGLRDSSKVQVLSGLKTGDTIITTGLLFLRPDADVKLSKVNE
jgi:membrane fusion protein, multidrug efflux system